MISPEYMFAIAIGFSVVIGLLVRYVPRKQTNDRLIDSLRNRKEKIYAVLKEYGYQAEYDSNILRINACFEKLLVGIWMHEVLDDRYPSNKLIELAQEIEALEELVKTKVEMESKPTL